jgi:hypothetical protein
MPVALTNVRYWGYSGLSSDKPRCRCLTDAVEKGFDSIVVSLDATFDGCGGGQRR